MLSLYQQPIQICAWPQSRIWLWVTRRTRDYISSPSNLFSAFRHPHAQGSSERSRIQHDKERSINAGVFRLLWVGRSRVGVHSLACSPTPPDRSIDDHYLLGLSRRLPICCRELLYAPTPRFCHPKLIILLAVLRASA